MKFIPLPALAAGMLLGLAGVAAAQQQGGQMQNMPGMDHSQMQNMPGIDHSNMQGMDHQNMPGMQRNAPAGRTAAPLKPSRPGTQTQPRTN